MVITEGSDSSNPSSNLGMTCFFYQTDLFILCIVVTQNVSLELPYKLLLGGKVQQQELLLIIVSAH